MSSPQPCIPCRQIDKEIVSLHRIPTVIVIPISEDGEVDAIGCTVFHRDLCPLTRVDAHGPVSLPQRMRRRASTRNKILGGERVVDTPRVKRRKGRQESGVAIHPTVPLRSYQCVTLSNIVWLTLSFPDSSLPLLAESLTNDKASGPRSALELNIINHAQNKGSIIHTSL